MRMSCHGCRVLRKGCSENCSIRPCLQWIKNPESQANATVFLAKFYGRAGLINLINAGPEHLRPAIFRSLLYEACGRIVNPIYGTVGLLWSGSWKLCQAAVEAVLKGSPIVQIPSETAASAPVPPLKAYDIRHISKVDRKAPADDGAPVRDLHKVRKGRKKFKRSGAKPRSAPSPPEEPEANPDRTAAGDLGWPRCYPLDFLRALSHESAASHDASEHAAAAATEEDGDSRENSECAISWETAEAGSHVSQGEPSHAEYGEVELELTLGFEPVHKAYPSTAAPTTTKKRIHELGSLRFSLCLADQ